MNLGFSGQGAIGNGAGYAQILQGNKGLDVLLRRQQQNAANARWQMQLGLQLEKERAARDRELFKGDFSKPGIYQQENSINEINSVRDLTRNYALHNPHASVGQIQEAVSQQRNNVERRVAKRNEMQPVLKEYQANVLKDPNKYDKEALNLIHDKVLYNVNPETGKIDHKDIDQIDPEQVQGILQHPSVHNAHALIVDTVAPIKKQLEMSDPAQTVNTGIGLLKEAHTNRVRFVKEDGTPGISDHLINYVLEANPNIENKFFWDVAQDRVKKAGGNPKDIDTVGKVYDTIRNSNDPSTLNEIKEKTRQSLDQLQQVSRTDKYINLGKFSQADKEGLTPTEEDYKITHDRIKQIRTEAHDVAKKISHEGTGMTLNVKYHNDKFEKLIAPLADGGIWDNKQIVKAEPEVKDGKYLIHLKVMDGTKTDANGVKEELLVDRYVNVNNDEQMFNLLNQLHGKKKHEKMNANQYMKLHGSSADEAAQLGLK